jgi:hypothetical protein
MDAFRFGFPPPGFTLNTCRLPIIMIIIILITMNKKREKKKKIHFAEESYRPLTQFTAVISILPTVIRRCLKTPTDREDYGFMYASSMYACIYAGWMWVRETMCNDTRQLQYWYTFLNVLTLYMFIQVCHCV